MTKQPFHQPLIDSALARRAWAGDAGAGQWSLQVSSGRAQLKHVGQRARWRQFEMKGGAFPVASSDRALFGNDGLIGPIKLVKGHKGDAVCRSDVPIDLGTSSSRTWCRDPSQLNDDPHDEWAAEVTCCASGNPQPKLPGEVSLGAVVDEIQQAGWSASSDDSQIHVHVSVAALFRKIKVEPTIPSGFKVVADLVELDGASTTTRQAILQLAGEANTRLPMVRLAIGEDRQPMTIRAEVHLGSALIHGAWLLAALEAVEAAILLTARELEALRKDQELAKIVLAAAPASKCNSK